MFALINTFQIISNEPKRSTCRNQQYTWHQQLHTNMARFSLTMCVGGEENIPTSTLMATAHMA